MDGPLYTEILKNDVLGTLKDLGIKKKDIYFQQDNDLKHTLEVACEWFKKNKLNVCPKNLFLVVTHFNAL